MSKKKEAEHLLNGLIKSRLVRVIIDDINEVMSIDKANQIAQQKGLDLVQINDGATPVCKIMDYGKFIYDRNKNRKTQKQKPLKEIRYTPNIGENDANFKLKHVRSFLSNGHKVKAMVIFKGREITHTDNGKKVLLDLVTNTEDIGQPEAMPSMDGDKYTVTLKPKLKN